MLKNMMRKKLLILLLMPLIVMAQGDVDTHIAVNDQEDINTFVLIVANENYKYEQSVPFALNDGETFRLYCEKTLGIPAKNIRYAADATLNDIRMQLFWLQQVMEAFGGDARAIVYYSGHGMPSEDGSHAYLLPVDGNSKLEGSGLSTSELYKHLGKMPTKGTMVFLDACFSGARRDGQMLASSRGVAIKSKVPSIKGNMVVFSAAQGDETAYPYTKKQHGLFTYYLLEQLQQHGGYVSLGELVDQVTKQVKRISIVENSKIQSPTVMASATIANWHQWMFAGKRASRYETVQRTKSYISKTNKVHINTAMETVVHQATTDEPLLPPWMKEIVINKWVGASPPTPDMQKGRSIALINAVLSYLRTQQLGKLKTVKHLNTTHVKTDKNIEDTEDNSETSEVEYVGFNCTLNDEYYNSRGEYFVRCTFGDDKHANQNRMLLKQTIIKKTSGKDSHLAVSVNITMELNGQRYLCSLKSDQKKDLQPTILISVNDVPLRAYNNLNYETIEWNTHNCDGALIFTPEDIGQSLGVTQMAFHTLLPFIPYNMEVLTLTEYSRVDAEEKFIFAGSIVADTLCRPLDITPMLLSSKGYVVKVHATNMANIDYNGPVYDKVTNTFMNIEYERNKNMGGFGRLLNIHNILNSAYLQVSNMIGSESHGQELSSGDETFKSSSRHSLTEIGVKWDFENIACWEDDKAKFMSRDVDNAPRGIWIKARCE